jgi:hypothetical protein
MSRLTLRLPDTLHQQLIELAEEEGVSLNQYIVYALTRQTTSSYTVRVVPASDREQQLDDFSNLLKQLGQAHSSKIEEVLAKRDAIEPEPELTSEVINRLKTRLKNSNMANG